MQWEILVAVILAIGICAAVLEARAKRAVRKNESKNAESEEYSVSETSTKQNK
jgi:hypothetical protein